MHAQLLLMNSGLHFSTFPVSTTSEIQQICEAQITGEVRVCAQRPPHPVIVQVQNAACAL